MTNLRTLALLLLVLCLAACGGGGGAPVVDPDDPQDPPPGGTDETTRAILEACLLPGLDDAFGMVDRLDDLLAGTGAAAGFSVVPGSVAADEFMLELLVSLDANGNQVEDGVGALRFLDGDGQPVNPFDTAQVDLFTSMGVGALGTLLPTLPDGYGLSLDLGGPTLPAVGMVSWVFESGLPTLSSGVLGAIGEPCVVNLGWQEQAWSGLLTAFPTGTFELTVTQDGDPDVETLDGSLVADGTAAALVDVARNGGDVTAWTFDLQLGQAEPR